jgi:hypothetical protein
MSDVRHASVEWDGNVLSGWLTIDGVPTKVTADRDAIHQNAAGFNDALTWEIARHRLEIFSRLEPYFREMFKPAASSSEPEGRETKPPI